MERRNRGTNGCSVFLLVAAVILVVLESFAAPAHCGRTVDDQKNYYTNPHDSSHSSPACPTPSHGSDGGNSTPETPSHGSGGHSTPKTPVTPSHGSGGSHSYPSPTSGGGSSPATPTISIPSPPAGYEPNVPPFHPGTCSYWISHPGRIVEVVGYVGTIGDFFGTACVFAVGGRNSTLHDAVANTSSGGVGALLREGTAALHNSLSCRTFPFTSQQVRTAFAAAVGSDGGASAQAAVFKLANEGRYKA